MQRRRGGMSCTSVSLNIPIYLMRFIMGMRIPSSGSVGSTQSASMAAWQQNQQNVKNLFSAVKSGDLASAQKAFSSLSGNNATVNGNSPLAQIGKALQNGDIAGAQTATQQLQASRSGHHHHANSTSSTDASMPAATPQVTTSSGIGSLLNLTA